MEMGPSKGHYKSRVVAPHPRNVVCTVDNCNRFMHRRVCRCAGQVAYMRCRAVNACDGTLSLS